MILLSQLYVTRSQLFFLSQGILRWLLPCRIRSCCQIQALLTVKEQCYGSRLIISQTCKDIRLRCFDSYLTACAAAGGV